MSRRRLAALAALVVVPLAVLAIVLLSTGSDDGGDQGTATTGTGTAAPAPARKGAPSAGQPSSAGGSRQTDRRPSSAPKTSLPVLDKGKPGSRGGDKLAPAVSNGTLDLAKLRGSPVVLNVWSSDCIPCREEARVLELEWERYGPQGVLFLGLNVQDSAAAAKKFRSTFGITYPAVAEKEADTARALGATSVPETFFLSDSGKVVDHVVGAVSLAQVELGIRAARTGHRIRTASGGPRTPLD